MYVCVRRTAVSGCGLRWGRGGILASVYQEAREISRELNAVLFKAPSAGADLSSGTNPTHPTSQSAHQEPNLVPRKSRRRVTLPCVDSIGSIGSRPPGETQGGKVVVLYIN